MTEEDGGSRQDGGDPDTDGEVGVGVGIPATGSVVGGDDPGHERRSGQGVDDELHNGVREEAQGGPARHRPAEREPVPPPFRQWEGWYGK